MSGFQRFDISSLPATPWKNGGGSTRELLSWPPGAGLEDFDWRVSIATIASDGPFSRFAGVDRQILLLGGAGVRLRSADGSVDHALTEPLRPFPFSGDLALDCRLLGGESQDFNLMARRAAGRAELAVLDSAHRWAGGDGGLLLCVEGAWQADDQALRPGQGLCWTAAAPALALSTTAADARLLAVRWTAAHSRTSP